MGHPLNLERCSVVAMSVVLTIADAGSRMG
jgi:hypothetical protein